ncbi:MAG: hypothetical protein EBR33_11525, partial [Synechococcaceae bacterium WB4_1_0192]|nr:hypothetical protein [Synechococcaceae bacterium WB4_1_0192]
MNGHRQSGSRRVAASGCGSVSARSGPCEAYRPGESGECSTTPVPPIDAFDHPIFTESIRLIRTALEPTGLYGPWAADGPERDVIERLVHSSGDLSLPTDLVLPAAVCQSAMVALAAGAPILTDTA